MEWAGIIRAVVALIGVIALLLGVAWLLRRFGVEKRWRMSGRGGLLGIEETLMLDTARRVVIVSREQKRYVLLLGEDRDLLLETYEEAAEELEDEDDDV